MKENRFSKNMNLKSDSELENIIENKEKYTEEALQAVIWELEKRKLVPENKIILEEEVNKEDLKNVTTELKEFSKDESAFDEFELPELYSKKAIQGFTIFFSTIFGAVLLMHNLKSMQKPKARIQVLIFSILYTVFVYVFLNTVAQAFYITIILNLIGYGVLTEFFWKKNLKDDLKYKKKEITKPLIISLLITGFLVFIAFLPLILEV